MKNNTDLTLIDVYPYKWMNGNPEFLLLKRSESVIYSGQWRMVGGKIQSNETASEAALRELKEETGISPITFWSVPSINSFFDFKLNKIHHIPVFSAEIETDRPITLNHEHNEFQWINIELAQKMLVWPEQVRLISLIHHILITGNIAKEWIIPHEQTHR